MSRWKYIGECVICGSSESDVDEPAALYQDTINGMFVRVRYMRGETIPEAAFRMGIGPDPYPIQK